MTARPARRTQDERRRATVGKLVDATIASLLEVGFHRTTVVEICRRAGVSHGGLFRHFASVLELVLAAAEEVARRQIAGFEAAFARVPEPERSLGHALRLLLVAARSPINSVFYELLVAARTNAVLRAALEQNAARYYDAIRAAALRVPGLAEVKPDLLEALLFGVTHLFDGEQIVRTVLKRPEQEELRLELLVGAVALLRPD